MALIKSQLVLTDGMTGPLKSINKAMNIVLNSFEAMQDASGRAIDTASIQEAREEFARASAALDQLEDHNAEPSIMAAASYDRRWKLYEEPEAEVSETAEPEVNHDEPMKMSDVVTKLESLFDILNRVYFDNALPKPVITVQSTPKAYGHCSTKKIWKSENDGQYEINIGAEFLNRPSANTAATMCHEMVHLYCLVNEIQDTCQKGRYHNKTFKAEAEARDLEIGYDRTVGFSHTNPTEAFKKTLEDNGFVLEVPFARVMPEEKAKAEREKPHRYVCPVCGQEVKTTADLSLICGICEVAMERAD